MKYIISAIIILLVLVWASELHRIQSEEERLTSAPAPIEEYQTKMLTHKIVMPPPSPKKTTINKSKAKPASADIKNNLISQLYNASMIFSVPEQANITDSIKAELLIDSTKELKELAKLITVKGEKTASTIKVSHKIVAKIVAPDFDVTNITPEEQVLIVSEPTQWLWNLDAKKPGIHDIDLSITAILEVDDATSSHSIKTYTKTIKIEIQTRQIILNWLSQYWQWMISTLILPLGIWYYKKKSAKEEAK